MARRWQLLTTLSDAPSAEALASLLRSEGITVRIASEAHMLGQAVPCRLLVDAAQLAQARWALSQHALSEEELLSLATGKVPL
jgi:Putative prokaryotic signal transducing protein